jgi:hypothetical protein
VAVLAAQPRAQSFPSQSAHSQSPIRIVR